MIQILLGKIALHSEKGQESTGDLNERAMGKDSRKDINLVHRENPVVYMV